MIGQEVFHFMLLILLSTLYMSGAEWKCFSQGRVVGFMKVEAFVFSLIRDCSGQVFSPVSLEWLGSVKWGKREWSWSGVIAHHSEQREKIAPLTQLKFVLVIDMRSTVFGFVLDQFRLAEKKYEWRQISSEICEKFVELELSYTSVLTGRKKCLVENSLVGDLKSMMLWFSLKQF